MPTAILRCCLPILTVLALAGGETTPPEAVRVPTIPQTFSHMPSRMDPVRTSVVQIRILDGNGNEIGTGSGFVFLQAGWLVTNRHVIGKAGAIQMVRADRTEEMAFGILAQDEPGDLAILSVPISLGPPLQPVPEGNGAIDYGLKIAVYGYPQGIPGDATRSLGEVTAFRTPADLGEVKPVTARVQHSAPIDFGSSGGPAVRESDGLVVGVIDSMFVSNADLNHFVPIDQVMALVATIVADAIPEPFPAAGSGMSLNLLISAAFFLVLFGLFWFMGRRRS